MKKILLCSALLVAISSQAQLLKKLKEKAGNAVNSNSKPREAVSTASSSSIANTAAANPNYTYLTGKQSAEKFGTKIQVIPNGFFLLWSMKGNVQYWMENNEIKYYYTIGIPTSDGNEFKDVKTIVSDGRTLKGTPKENKLPLSKEADPPCINGYGTFEDETSERNYENISSNKRSDIISISTATDASYKQSFTITVSNKKLGSYQGMPMGVYSYKSGKTFFVSSTTEYMSNELFIDGKSVYKSNELFATVAGDPQCSADGTKALFNVMPMNNIDPNGRMPYLFSNGKMVQPFSDGSNHTEYKLMNSGQLLKKIKDGSANAYMLDGKTELVLPSNKGSLDFFSNENVTKWASQEPYIATYFSDGTAIKNDFAPQDIDTFKNPVLSPKKIAINGKSYLVWLQQQGNDLFLCKKEM